MDVVEDSILEWTESSERRYTQVGRRLSNLHSTGLRKVASVHPNGETQLMQRNEILSALKNRPAVSDGAVMRSEW
jgi:hypothetical protein